MPLRLRDETAAVDVLEISGGGVLIGIGGAADSVHILAVCGNPIIKSSGIAYDNTVISSAAVPSTGSVTTDGSGNATITTSTGQAATTSSGTNITTLGTNSIAVHGLAPSTSYHYAFW
jgi:hypothetical protein